MSCHYLCLGQALWLFFPRNITLFCLQCGQVHADLGTASGGSAMRRAHCTVLSVSHWPKAWELRAPLFQAQQDAAVSYAFLKRGGRC